MDALDNLVTPASDLLGRVDDLLVRAGAPGDHPIWPLLRRLGVLPGEAVGALVALSPAPLAAAASALRDLMGEYDEAYAVLARGGSWEGAGAEAFAAHRGALASQIAGGADNLSARLAATAAYADATASWIADARSSLAAALADVLASAEAVAVVAGGGLAAEAETMRPAGVSPASATAAARIGARILSAVLDAYEAAELLLHRSAPTLAEVPFRPPAEVATRLDATTRIAL
jgi:hypothetical protein